MMLLHMGTVYSTLNKTCGIKCLSCVRSKCMYLGNVYLALSYLTVW